MHLICIISAKLKIDLCLHWIYLFLICFPFHPEIELPCPRKVRVAAHYPPFSIPGR